MPGRCLRLLLMVFLSWSATAHANATDVVIVGDSTVQDWPTTDTKRGWGQMLPGYFAADVTVANHAMGGRSSKTFRAEGRWTKVLAAKPRLVLIQFGHNDAHGPGRPESTDAQTDFRDNMLRYVDEAKAAGISVVLVTPPPHRIPGPRGGMDGGLAPYATVITAVAKDRGIPCIDLFATAGGMFNGLSEEARVALFCSTEDRSHFSIRGASLLAKMIAEALAQEPLTKGMLRKPGDWPAIARSVDGK